MKNFIVTAILMFVTIGAASLFFGEEVEKPKSTTEAVKDVTKGDGGKR